MGEQGGLLGHDCNLMIVEILLLELAFSLMKNWRRVWQASSSLLRHGYTHTRASGDHLKSHMVEEYRGAGVVATYEKQ